MREPLDAVHGALALLDDDRRRRALAGHAARLADRVRPCTAWSPAGSPGCCYDAGRARRADEAARGWARRCQRGTPPARRPPGSRASWPAAACCWCTTSDLLALVDGWLAGHAGRRFIDVLPLLRRTFGAFAGAGAARPSASGSAGGSGRAPPASRPATISTWSGLALPTAADPSAGRV